MNPPAPLRCLAVALLLNLLAVPALHAQDRHTSLPEALDPVKAAQEGRELALRLLAQGPDRGHTNTGLLRIKAGKAPLVELPVSWKILPGQPWLTVFETAATTNRPAAERLTITHTPGQPNRYELAHLSVGAAAPRELRNAALMAPFAGSDFWLADLGLEFFHWPSQRVLKKEMRRSQMCYVLESTAPPAQTQGYARVVAWIDTESGGIVYAEAFDTAGKPVKDFAPKDFKKVNGTWELEEMEIRNRQTGSRTTIQFKFGE